MVTATTARLGKRRMPRARVSPMAAAGRTQRSSNSRRWPIKSGGYQNEALRNLRRWGAMFALLANTYTLPPDKLAKAIEYARARNRLYFVAVAYGIAVLIALIYWKAGPR